MLNQIIEYNAVTKETTVREVEVVDTVDNYIISYDELVVQLIREKYSLDEELAIQRQRDIKTLEFQAYFDYCEECKIRAKTVLNII